MAPRLSKGAIDSYLNGGKGPGEDARTRPGEDARTP